MSCPTFREIRCIAVMGCVSVSVLPKSHLFQGRSPKLGNPVDVWRLRNKTVKTLTISNRRRRLKESNTCIYEFTSSFNKRNCGNPLFNFLVCVAFANFSRWVWDYPFLESFHTSIQTPHVSWNWIELRINGKDKKTLSYFGIK